MKSALVLAGGGVAGIAWELGVLRGLADFDPALADDVIAADLATRGPAARAGREVGRACAPQVAAFWS